MNDVTQLAPQPAHIPDAAVYDFDIFHDAALLKNPHERVREILRDAPPIFWTRRNGGHWVAMGHDACFEVSRDWDKFTSGLVSPEMEARFAAMAVPGGKHIPRSVPITLDPPDHAKFRAPLAAPFGPKAIKARADQIRALAADLIDAVAPQGHCEFVSAVAEQLPVQVFMKMMGLPLERFAEFRRLVHVVLGPGMMEPGESPRRMRMVADAIDDVILARKNDPKDDLISQLWKSEIDGEEMTLERMEDFGVLLFVAGLDTVINGIGFAVRHLAMNPDLQNQLRADPSLIPEASEEILRRYTFTVPPRRVAKDTEFMGWQMKADERVLIYLAGADLDPTVFDAPDTIEMNREKAHIAFGVGPHRCLGSHLARLELQILYAEVLKRLPEFRLDPDAPATFHAGAIIAMDTLPLRWD
jgi:cytochrome P450